MIINKIAEPKVVLVGNPNLINFKMLPKLMLNYQNRLDDENKRSVAYFDLSIKESSGKHLKANFNDDVDELSKYCEMHEITTIASTNPDFFRFATGSKQFTANIGKAVEGIDRLSGYTIVPLLNAYVLLSKPQSIGELNRGVDALNEVLNGTYIQEVNKLDAVKPTMLTDLKEIKEKLAELVDLPKVALDIETTGLTLGVDTIITIAIATSPTESYSFPTCYQYSDDYKEIREELKQFFINYKGQQLWYNAMFDIPFIMRDLLDIDVYNRKHINTTLNNWDIVDVMHLKYLCVNGLQRVGLGLKEELMDIYGEYDSSIDQAKLLDYPYQAVGKYNCYDTTGTFEAYNKYSVKIYKEEQNTIYEEYYKPSLVNLIKLKYTGAVIDMDKLDKADEQLTELLETEYELLSKNKYIKEVEEDLNYNAMFKYNSSHVKQKTVSEFDIKFNPNSSAHKVLLLIDTFGYDVIETTSTGNPSVGKEVVAEYLASEDDKDKQEVLEALLSIADANKVKTAFIDGLKKLAVKDSKGKYRVHTDYKLHGTMSGRLSAANPNLQQIPSNSKYGKLVKGLFTPPSADFIFASSDFNALEDRVGAEETRDDAKVKVMTGGYDSHSLNTASYFAKELEERGLPFGKDITVEESMIIKEKAPDLRQASKEITFGLAYGGTSHTVKNSLGCSEEKAQEIVDAYHELYSGVQKYYDRYLASALANDCRMITPHGLIIRCPELLAEEQHVAEKAGRSVCNALIQGLSGQLMVKAINRIQARIELEGLDDDIQLVTTIHDAVYAYVRRDNEIIKRANEIIISEMVKDYKEDQMVKNLANLDIGEHWADQNEIPNNATVEAINNVLYNKEEKVA